MDDKQTTLDLFSSDNMEDLTILENESDFIFEDITENVNNNKLIDEINLDLIELSQEHTIQINNSYEELELASTVEFDLSRDDYTEIPDFTEEIIPSKKFIPNNQPEKDSFVEIEKFDVIDNPQLEDVEIKVDKDLQLMNSIEYGRVNIMVIGVGGCGCNAVNRMFDERIKEIKLIAIDTSEQTLENISADYKMLLGEDVFSGHGSGGDTSAVERVIGDSKEQIRQILSGVDMLFLAGGIGKGTGSVGVVEIGKIAREMNILTIGFATLPRTIETNTEIIQKYYPQFIDAVDSNIIVENERIGKIAHNLPLMEAMRLADSMLVEGIKGIFELITKPGKINLDYADIRTAFSSQGSCVMGIGKGTGEDAVLKAINNSIHSDIANIESVKNSKTIIFNITCAPRTVTIDEASRGSDLIYSFGQIDNIKHLLFGYSYDESLGDEIKVTFIATGTTPTEIKYIQQTQTARKFTFEPQSSNTVDLNKKKSIFEDINTLEMGNNITEEIREEIHIPDFFSKK